MSGLRSTFAGGFSISVVPPQPGTAPQKTAAERSVRASRVRVDRIGRVLRPLKKRAPRRWGGVRADRHGTRPRQRRRAGAARAQSESALTTSPRLRVPIAHQGDCPTVSLTNFTEPSVNPTFTPPGWLLVGGTLQRGPHQYSWSGLFVYVQRGEFGA